MANHITLGDDYRHVYWLQQQEGAHALNESECPYHASAGEVGKRCAWLAGFRDDQAKRNLNREKVA
ncbi:hypothetical protein ACIGCM_03810 [Pseudomonas sp. NPDC078700]|uniref:hypothetical protein n=1 Tax=Pseudomonas sp. NPDC078700 TaxID=3364424 RepID=UPI0037C9BC0E